MSKWVKIILIGFLVLIIGALFLDERIVKGIFTPIASDVMVSLIITFGVCILTIISLAVSDALTVFLMASTTVVVLFLLWYPPAIIFPIHLLKGV